MDYIDAERDDLFDALEEDVIAAKGDARTSVDRSAQYPDFAAMSDEEFRDFLVTQDADASDGQLREQFDRSKRRQEDEAFRAFARERRTQAAAVNDQLVQRTEAEAILRADEEREVVASVDWETLSDDEFWAASERVQRAQDRIASRYGEGR